MKRPKPQWTFIQMHILYRAPKTYDVIRDNLDRGEISLVRQFQEIKVKMMTFVKSDTVEIPRRTVGPVRTELTTSVFSKTTRVKSSLMDVIWLWKSNIFSFGV